MVNSASRAKTRGKKRDMILLKWPSFNGPQAYPMSDPARDFAPLIDRLDALFDRLEAVLPTPLPPTDWSATAFRWRTRGGRGWLEAVKQPHRIRFEDLQGVEDQKQRIAQNTKQFVAGAQRQQRAADRRARHRQELAGQGGAEPVCGERPAPDRSGQGRIGAPAGDRGPGRRAPRALHHLLRRPFLRVGRARLQGDEEHPRRLDHRYAGQPAGVCDLEPPPPDAGKDVGEPRNQARRRRRHPSRRDHRGEGLALRALRPVAVLLPLRPGPLPGNLRALAGRVRRAGRQDRGRARRGAAMEPDARLAQRPRRLAVRPRLRRAARRQDGPDPGKK
jgi:hypothetical protein